MKKLSKKKKKAERVFILSIVLLTLSLCLLFVSMLDVVYNYYPGNPEQEQMIAFAIITFMCSGISGFFTAKALHKYNTLIHLISIYKRGQKNKMEIH